ncbi:MAG: hypothetical protein PVG71_04425 [Anaerolineae bacterium]|jgi:beta-phosphoglucomutase-like phosphatase (HAD superfamily)
MTKIKAVIFDLGGVLTSTAEYHYRAWRQLADGLTVAFDRQRNEALRGVSCHCSLELPLNGHPATERWGSGWRGRTTPIRDSSSS